MFGLRPPFFVFETPGEGCLGRLGRSAGRCLLPAESELFLESPEGEFTVSSLTPVLGCNDRDTRGYVGQPDSRLNLVPMLPAGASCPEGLDSCLGFEPLAVGGFVHLPSR